MIGEEDDTADQQKLQRISATSVPPPTEGLISPSASRARRFSTIDDYYQSSRTRDWLEQERKFLKLEALYQRKSNKGIRGHRGVISGLSTKIGFRYQQYAKSYKLTIDETFVIFLVFFQHLQLPK